MRRCPSARKRTLAKYKSAKTAILLFLDVLAAVMESDGKVPEQVETSHHLGGWKHLMVRSVINVFYALHFGPHATLGDSESIFLT